MDDQGLALELKHKYVFYSVTVILTVHYLLVTCSQSETDYVVLFKVVI